MASLALTVNDVTVQNGRMYIMWSDNTQQEFSSLADAQSLCDELAANKDLLKILAIARYLRQDPTASTPSIIEGKTITFDDTTNNLVTVSA